MHLYRLGELTLYSLTDISESLLNMKTVLSYKVDKLLYRHIPLHLSVGQQQVSGEPPQTGGRGAADEHKGTCHSPYTPSDRGPDEWTEDRVAPAGFPRPLH